MKRLRVIDRPRSEDEVLLDMLDMRVAGKGYGTIAKALGLRPHQVRDQSKKIRLDDMAEHDPRAAPDEYERFYR